MSAPVEREWIHVRCHQGHRRHDRPLAVVVDGVEDEIEHVQERWLEQSVGGTPARYFRVQLASGRQYVIAHEIGADRWFLHGVIPGAHRP